MNEKTVSLCIRCGKVTANLLKAAMVKALAKMEQEKKQQGQKTNQKQPQKEKEDKTYKGKQSLDKLMKQNVQPVSYTHLFVKKLHRTVIWLQRM